MASAAKTFQQPQGRFAVRRADRATSRPSIGIIFARATRSRASSPPSGTGWCDPRGGALSQRPTQMMVFNRVEAAAKTWRRLKGPNQCLWSPEASHSPTLSPKTTPKIGPLVEAASPRFRIARQTPAIPNRPRRPSAGSPSYIAQGNRVMMFTRGMARRCRRAGRPRTATGRPPHMVHPAHAPLDPTPWT